MLRPLLRLGALRGRVQHHQRPERHRRPEERHDARLAENPAVRRSRAGRRDRQERSEAQPGDRAAALQPGRARMRHRRGPGRDRSARAPATITVRSSQAYKRHFYFSPPAELDTVTFVCFRFESGKVTADTERYLIAPPSIHPTGAEYAFLPGLGPLLSDTHRGRREGARGVPQGESLMRLNRLRRRGGEGAWRIRTAVHGFAGRYLTTRSTRRGKERKTENMSFAGISCVICLKPLYEALQASA